MERFSPVQLRRVGLLSLSALLSGGIVLVYAGLNCILGPQGNRNGAAWEDVNYAKPFQYGSRHSVQFWLIIIGAGLNMLSYGYRESYEHLFDWWCSRKLDSKRGGLDYARYLNSQPRAPVWYGVRGFPALTTIKHTIVSLTIATSIGYKLAVVEVPVLLFENLEEGHITLQVPPTVAINRGMASPWLLDSPESFNNHAFIHEFGKIENQIPDMREPLDAVLMAGAADCNGIFTPLDTGRIYTREIIIIANKTEDVMERNVTNSHDRWHTVALSWGIAPFYNSVEYRGTQTGGVQLRYSSLNISTNMNDTRRLNYEMALAVAEISRKVERSACFNVDVQRGTADVAIIMSTHELIVPNPSFKYHLDEFWYGIDNIITSTTLFSPADATGALLRAAMAALGNQTLGIDLGHVQRGRKPFDDEDVELSARNRLYPNMDYPFFIGRRTGRRTGLNLIAAKVFVAFGFIAIITVGIRLWAGPALLTSWMGYHVYLAALGKQGYKTSDGSFFINHEAALNWGFMTFDGTTVKISATPERSSELKWRGDDVSVRSDGSAMPMLRPSQSPRRQAHEDTRN